MQQEIVEWNKNSDNVELAEFLSKIIKTGIKVENIIITSNESITKAIASGKKTHERATGAIILVKV